MPKQRSKPVAVLPPGEKNEETLRFGLNVRTIRFSFRLKSLYILHGLE